MTNDQANAANVLEGTLDLIRQVLLKHETAVIAEFRTAIEAKKHELGLIYAERDKAISDTEDLRTICAEQFERANEWRAQAEKARQRAERAEMELGYSSDWMNPIKGPLDQGFPGQILPQRHQTRRSEATVSPAATATTASDAPVAAERFGPGCGGDWTDEGWFCSCGAAYPRQCKSET